MRGRRILRKRAATAAPKEADQLVQQLLFAEYSGEEVQQALELAENVGGASPLEEEIRRLVRRDPGGTEKLPARPARRIVPPNAYGMPLLGRDVLELANVLSSDVEIVGKGKDARLTSSDDVLDELIRGVLYSAGSCHLPVTVKGDVRKRFTVVSGHLWGYHHQAHGPTRADVMVIGKCLGEEERNQGRQFIGPTGDFLRETLDDLGIVGYDDWYMTNLLKIEHPEAATGGSRLTKPWVKEWLPFLYQELRIVQPKYILCLGADAADALLSSSNLPEGVTVRDSDGRDAFPGRKKATVKGMEGRVVEFAYPLSTDRDGIALKHTALVMVATHPAAVLRDPTSADVYTNGIARFGQLAAGNRPDREEQGLDHREIDSIEELKDLYYEIRQTCEDNLLGLDAEWHGEHPQNAGSYLRTIQISWKHKTAVCIHVRHAGGKWRFRGGKKALIYWVNKIVKGRRVAGQFFNADLEWLRDFGLTIPYSVADSWEECMRLALRKKLPQGAFDTGLAAHAINETGEYGLTSLTLRFTSAPRYDVELSRWRDDYCNLHKIKKEELEGYGECPDEILVPYACLHYDSLVQLGDGSWQKIGKLVGQRYGGTVKATIDGRVVNARVVDWHRADVGQKSWFRLRTATTAEGRFGLTGPKFTPDHEILTQRGKVRVDQLRPGEDKILTDEVQFSSEQLSVFLGSGLGDGGYVRKNGKKVGFGFGQCSQRAGYADWKASVFANYRPVAITAKFRRYVLPFSRYLRHLADRFPSKPITEDQHRKLLLTRDVLDNLGDLGLSVWYQDDGVLVRDKRCGSLSSRIICRKFTEEEVSLAVDWLSGKFGRGVSYNAGQGFLQITGEAFRAFHAAVDPYIHADVAYKSLTAATADVVLPAGTDLFYETIDEVVPWQSTKKQESGVRYCLTVEHAHNFLTSAGFVSNCYDADVTRRLVYVFQKLLTSDAFGNNCWEAFWMDMRAYEGVYEINTSGLLINRERLDRLTDAYLVARAELKDKLCHWANWPDFNINSAYQVRELLFGEALNGKKRKPGEPVVRLRPKPGDTCRACRGGGYEADDVCSYCQGSGVHAKGGRSMYLDPIMSTDKRPMVWSEVIERQLEEEKTPSTNKSALAILAQENQSVLRRSPKTGRNVLVDYSKYIGWIRDYRFVGQVLKSVLRPPLVDEESADVILDEDGNYSYGGGLPSVICDDGRVRTHIYPTKETGRWSSARPPLQNLSKRRESDYKRILGPGYLYPIRTMIQAFPGYVLVEADYSGAELYGMALMSGDVRMIADYESGADIHSNIAVLAFNLDCEPSKVGLRSVPNPKNPTDPDGCEFLRIVAKSVIFGIAYGRGAKAIALAAKEEGISLTVEEAQRVIDTIFVMYPDLVPFFAECRNRVVNPRWLCGCFGRFRRFPTARERVTLGDFERQAMNFPIQGMIADAMSLAIDNLLRYRKANPHLDYQLLLQIHDAVLLAVRYEHVAEVMDTVIPYCMEECVPIYPTRLDGVPTGAGPFVLRAEREPYLYWGELMMPNDHLRCGVPARLSGWKEVDGGFRHKNFVDQNKQPLLWLGDENGGSFTTTA